MPKKLRVSVNNPQTSSQRPLSPTVYVTQYHWPRIIGAGLVLLGLIVVLYFWAASDDVVDEKGLASDGDIDISSPASSETSEVPVFVEPGSDSTDEAVATEAEETSVPNERPAVNRQQVPVPRDTTREGAFGGDRPLAESLSDQVHQRPQAGDSPSILAPESESERSKYRLTVQDEPVARPKAPAEAAPSQPKGPSPEGIMSVQSNKVLRAVITDAVSNSEPAKLLNDPVRIGSGRQTTVHLFAEVEDLKGETLRLLWFHAGSEVLSLPLRVHSEKAVLTSSVTIESSQSGDWQVEVRDASGQPMASGHFQVTNQ
ncbi:DUF2914 domain-containing protein [Allohahella marinimesophila]|uniref:DUF2914 domain-containing protein n=1 Tax=Allohahella marinimesophila TaxID=1054972 RepID=A0ABP7NVB6_9GAMM